jgi:hypothetical protein
MSRFVWPSRFAHSVTRGETPKSSGIAVSTGLGAAFAFDLGDGDGDGDGDGALLVGGAALLVAFLVAAHAGTCRSASRSP